MVEIPASGPASILVLMDGSSGLPTFPILLDVVRWCPSVLSAKPIQMTNEVSIACHFPACSQSERLWYTHFAYVWRKSICLSLSDSPSMMLRLVRSIGRRSISLLYLKRRSSGMIFSFFIALRSRMVSGSINLPPLVTSSVILDH